MGMPDNDGWIEWTGGECPVPAGAFGFIKFRDGEISPDCGKPDSLDDLEWEWWPENSNGDIIAYRVVQS